MSVIAFFFYAVEVAADYRPLAGGCGKFVINYEQAIGDLTVWLQRSYVPASKYNFEKYAIEVLPQFLIQQETSSTAVRYNLAFQHPKVTLY